LYFFFLKKTFLICDSERDEGRGEVREPDSNFISRVTGPMEYKDNEQRQ
jgi:hypothetical protein